MNAGFYKVEGNAQLLYAPEMVAGPGYFLVAADKDTYVYPVDGWQWFENEAAARETFNLPPRDIEPVDEQQT